MGDLSWAGHEDIGWFEVPPPPVDKKAQAQTTIASILAQTLEKVAVDNTSISKGERQQWLEYRRLISEVPLQGGFPDKIFWPTRPE